MYGSNNDNNNNYNGYNNYGSYGRQNGYGGYPKRVGGYSGQDDDIVDVENDNDTTGVSIYEGNNYYNNQSNNYYGNNDYEQESQFPAISNNNAYGNSFGLKNEEYPNPFRDNAYGMELNYDDEPEAIGLDDFSENDNFLERPDFSKTMKRPDFSQKINTYAIEKNQLEDNGYEEDFIRRPDFSKEIGYQDEKENFQNQEEVNPYYNQDYKNNYYKNDFENNNYQENNYENNNYEENSYKNDTKKEETKAKSYNVQDDDYEINVMKPTVYHAVFGTIMALVGMALVGFICGELVKSVFSSFWEKHISADGMLMEAIRMFGIIIAAWFFSIVHVIIHEIGHLFGGIVTSYELVSIRFLSWTFVKEGKKLSCKKYSVPGISGECIMMPPEGEGDKYPFMLYKLGGIILNLLTSLVALVVYMEVGVAHKYPLNMVCIIFAMVGLITIIYNGIPLIINGIPNDGYTIVQLVTSEEARKAVHSQLLVNAFLSKGGRYTDIPYEQFMVSDSVEYAGYLVVKVKMLEYKWHLENMDFVNAAECLNSMDSYYKKLPRIYQYDISCEKMFLELVGANSKEKIEDMYTGDVKTYIEDTQTLMSTSRLLMAYQACYKKNMKSANKYYNLLKESVKSEPLKGEADLELMLAEYIYDRFCSNTFSK